MFQFVFDRLCRTRVLEGAQNSIVLEADTIIDISLEVTPFIKQGIMQDSSSGTSALKILIMSQSISPSHYAGFEF